MGRTERLGLAIERLFDELEAQKKASNWDRKLKCAGYMHHRDDYEGTTVPSTKTHDATAVECLGTFMDGFVGYLMPQDDEWFKLMPRKRFSGGKADKEYGGFGALMDEDGVMELMDELTDVALNELYASSFYDSAKMTATDGEVFGNGFIYVGDDPEGGCFYEEIDPQECVIAENSRKVMDVFLRKFRKSPIDIVRDYPDATLEHCWERVRKGATPEIADVDIYEAILPNDYLYDNETQERFSINGGDARKVSHIVWIPLEREIVKEGSFNEMPIFTYAPIRDNSKTPYGKGMVNKYIEEIVLLDKMINLKHVQFEKNVNPPTLVHQSLQGNYSTKAGAQIYTADLATQGAQPLFKEGASNNYGAMVQDIQEQKDHIRQLMNADLFRTLMASTDSRKTAYEVSELKNEAVTLLSMKVGTFAHNVVEPIIKRTLKIKIRKGEINIPMGLKVEQACAFVDSCTVMLNSVFVRRLQGYLRYQGLVAGIQFIGAFAQFEQTQSAQVLNMDAFLRSGLYGSGFPAYCIKDAKTLKKERKEAEQMAQQMAQAQMQEQNAKSFSNMGRGMQAMQSAGVDVDQAMGGGYGQQQ